MPVQRKRTMAVIGGIVFVQAVGGQIALPYPRVRMIDRAGTDGRVVRFMPAKSEPVEWRTIEWVLLAGAALVAQNRYDLLRSGFVTAIDDAGRSIGSVVVLDVQVEKVQRLTVAVPPANYAVHARWTLIRPA